MMRAVCKGVNCTGLNVELPGTNATVALQQFVRRTSIGVDDVRFELRLPNLSLFVSREHLKLNNIQNLINLLLISLARRM